MLNIPDIFNSNIKELRIELPNYHYCHSLSEESCTQKSDFVGRKQILEKLISLINDTDNKTGVYLVTGNRGVGKTSFVNKAINKINEINEIQKKDKKLLHLHINFGNNLIEKDILRLIVYELNTKLDEKDIDEETIQELESLNHDIVNSTERERENKICGFGSIELKILGMGGECKVEGESGEKKKKIRSVADTREIETRLLWILKQLNKDKKRQIIIVFDELDKVEQGEPSTKASIFSINATRERQTEILKILSNMKYFLTTAQVKFIFIAGREMYDLYLNDVSERSNYTGSIFNTVIYVPSFLTDHAGDINLDMTLLTEEFVCRKLIPEEYSEKYEKKEKKEIAYNLKSYQEYLEKGIFKTEELKKDIEKNKEVIQEIDQKKHKIIAVLQQLIIYLTHVSKGAPKKMIQLFESFIEVAEKGKNYDNSLTIERIPTLEHIPDEFKLFLTFDDYRQNALGMTAYLITPVFNRLSEANIRAHSDKLLVSALRFVDFLFKFHKHTFSWRNLEISPELLEVNRSPELKSVSIDLLNYLTQTHITKLNFSLNDYKFDSLIANEIFAMTKTDEVFSSLHSFSLDEILPLKKYYKDLLEKTQEKFKNNKDSDKFVLSIASLQVVLGDLYYYDNGLEEAEMYYEKTIHTLRYLAQKNKEEGSDETMTMEELYLFVRNMLKLGMVLEKRKQYDFAYLTYGELCKRIIRERNIAIKELKAGIVLRKSGDKDVFVKAYTVKKTSENEKERLDKEQKKYYDNIQIPQKGCCEEDVEISIAEPQPLFFKKISPNTNDMLFKKMTFEGLKLLYLPFIAKLQILEKSHVGGITRNHLEQLDREFEFLTSVIDHQEAKILEADFLSRVADIIYYKNSDLMEHNKNKNNENKKIKKSSCTACHYYRKALFILLNEENKQTLPVLLEKAEKYTPLDLLSKSIYNIEDNYNMKHCTVLARILSDWGNVFYSCDVRCDNQGKKEICYSDEILCNTPHKLGERIFENLINCLYYVNSESNGLTMNATDSISKMEIAFAMYAVSLKAYSKANMFKRSAYQIQKLLRLFKSYELNKEMNLNPGENIKILGEKAIRSLWQAAGELNVFELNKRRKAFGKETVKDTIPLQYLLVDSEINRIQVLVKQLELKTDKTPQKLKEYYGLHIASPYSINYSISARIYQLRLKSIVNYETYKILYDTAVKFKKYKKIIQHSNYKNDKNYVKKHKTSLVLLFILQDKDAFEKAKTIFNGYYHFPDNDEQAQIQTMLKVMEKLIAETIFCFKRIISLSKTIDETYLFSHSFMGSVHDKLSDWIIEYEKFRMIKNDIENGTNNKLIDFFDEKDYKLLKETIIKHSRIDYYLECYLGKEWKEQLSGYFENQQALSHYYKCLETHSEGSAYHNIIDKMCHINDDYNDRSDHFNIAEERHYIFNDKIEKRINEVKERYKDSGLYKAENYFSNNSKKANYY